MAVPVGGAPAAPAPPRRRRRDGFFLLLRIMRANRLTLFGFALVVVISVTAVLQVGVPAVTQLTLHHAYALTPYSASELTNDVGQSPSLQHPMGTDSLGRDVFSEVLAALPLDLAIGFGVAGFALLFGGALGLVAGYWDRPGSVGGAVSVIIMRLTDIFLAFPSLVLALAVAASLGRGTLAAIVAVMVTWWPFYVRLTRGEVLSIKNAGYVTAARAAGVREGRIVLRHIVRNIAEPIVVYFTMDVGTVLVTFSTISYIGIGVPLSVPEWGNLIEQGVNANLLLTEPWVLIGPGLAVFVTVLAFSLLGDGLRDILDPRSRRALATASTPPAEAPTATAVRAEA
jgi:peptide/nickel transport system permease protein